MCKPMSGVLTKTAAFWSKNGERHTQILEENNLHSDGVRGPNIACFEIVPPNAGNGGPNFGAPLTEWTYSVDANMTPVLPPWYDAAECEARARVALGEWAARKIVRGAHAPLMDGDYYIIAGGSAAVRGGSAAVRGGSAVVWGGSAEVYGGSAVVYSGSAVVWGGSAVLPSGSYGTVITYIAMRAGMIQSASAVVVDRSVSPTVCYVGPQPDKAEAKKGGAK